MLHRYCERDLVVVTLIKHTEILTSKTHLRLFVRDARVGKESALSQAHILQMLVVHSIVYSTCNSQVTQNIHRAMEMHGLPEKIRPEHCSVSFPISLSSLSFC